MSFAHRNIIKSDCLWKTTMRMITGSFPWEKKIHKFHPLLNNITQRDKGKASNTTRFKPLLGFLNSNARSAILQNKQPKNERPFIQQYL